jgi:hypothetical protein
MASGGGSTSAASGCLHSERTGWPLAASKAAESTTPTPSRTQHGPRPPRWRFDKAQAGGETRTPLHPSPPYEVRGLWAERAAGLPNVR